MATLLLAAAGSAIGAGVGGSVLGLGGAVIGRAVGATIGQAIDQRLLGRGSEPVETGRVDRLRLMGTGEGAPLPLVWGRVRLGGQVIWASPYTEARTETEVGGGKGGSSQTVIGYSYSVSLAVALCEGPILRVGRVWADGVEVNPDKLGMRIYTGDANQQPDAKIAAVLGAANTPAYRGVAYVVFEDLQLEPFGNRVPQFSFEVMREAQVDNELSLGNSIRAVAMIPGTGEYALSPTKVHYKSGKSKSRNANSSTPRGGADFNIAFRALREELPNIRSISLVVSWFGDDLRCGHCTIRPKVESKTQEGVGMPWHAGGITRADALEVPRLNGNSVYGGTPDDASVIAAIQKIKTKGIEVMFYPFVLMEQLTGNGLPDPYGGAEQGALPWRGRITLDLAPGMDGTSDGTAAAAAEVAALFGAASVSDFANVNGRVVYSGPMGDWGLRRMILHYAHLCAVAGGVDVFCIGSELRGITRIRGAGNSFPAVQALRALAADVRSVLGAGVKITYAADWSEYGAYTIGDDLHFPLDALWGDANVDFVGIDNYLPLSDWRDGTDHLDAAWGDGRDLGYLMANVAGGEGFDWYYDSAEGEANQNRQAITDGTYGEPWVYRAKDLRGWWENAHHPRLGGVRQSGATAWVPMSKPIRFTEYGCPAIDKGANQPNLFYDPRSSESAVPRASTGGRDDLAQMQYFRAMRAHWTNAGHNPASPLYGGPMVDFDRSHAWAWDARPYPAFPAQGDLWGDVGNYGRGHWLNGRATNQPLSAVVAEIAAAAGVTHIDTSALNGAVRGYALGAGATGRSALQTLLLTAGVDAFDRGGALVFRPRRADSVADLMADQLVEGEIDGADFDITRAPEAEAIGRLRVSYTEAEGEYQPRVTEGSLPDADPLSVADQEAPLVLLESEARFLAERWLAEAQTARETCRLALPPSLSALGVGDVVTFQGQKWRIDRADLTESQKLECVRIENAPYVAGPMIEDVAVLPDFTAPVPVYPLFLDLPLLKGTEVDHAPHVAVAGAPWPGRVAIWAADGDDGFDLAHVVAAPALIGVTETPLYAAQVGLWDRGPALRVRLEGGAVASALQSAVLNGANAAAIGDGSTGNWEVFQFAEAAPVSADVWELSLRLRGQAGSDAVMPAVWPVGSQIVILNRAVGQMAVPLNRRGMARTYRVGAASRGYDDADVVVRQDAFDGIGLRPYAVAHLRAKTAAAGVLISWIRRTRIDGDSWASAEVPLGEEAERYLLRVMRNGAVMRTAETTSPNWTYSPEMRAADGLGAVDIAVAQVSARFGVGPFRTVGVV